MLPVIHVIISQPCQCHVTASSRSRLLTNGLCPRSCQLQSTDCNWKLCSVRGHVAASRYSLLSFWLQTATNYAVFRSFITQSTVQYQQLFYKNFQAIFPKTVSNLKELLFCIVLHSCTMYW